MAGSDISQKRKKHMKSLVFIPEEAGMLFADEQGKCRFPGNQVDLTDVVDTGPHSPEHDQDTTTTDAGLRTS